MKVFGLWKLVFGLIAIKLMEADSNLNNFSTSLNNTFSQCIDPFLN
jgi:hypothetical protein